MGKEYAASLTDTKHYDVFGLCAIRFNECSRRINVGLAVSDDDTDGRGYIGATPFGGDYFSHLLDAVCRVGDPGHVLEIEDDWLNDGH